MSYRSAADAIPPTRVLADQLPILRARCRPPLSQPGLVAKLRDVGFATSQPAIARTEAQEGKGRKGVTIEEVFALALALDASPVHIIVPHTKSYPVAITPTRSASPRAAREWIRGQRPLPGQDERTFRLQEVSAYRRAAEATSLHIVLDRVRDLVDVALRERKRTSPAFADAVEAINKALDAFDADRRHEEE